MKICIAWRDGIYLTVNSTFSFKLEATWVKEEKHPKSSCSQATHTPILYSKCIKTKVVKVICSSPVRVSWGRWALGRPCRKTDIHRVCSRLLRPWRWSQRDQLDRQMTRRVLGNPLETRGHPGCRKNAKNRHFLHPRTSNHLEEKAKGAINNQANEK